MSDTYSGRVVPGGPVDVRELPDLTIRKLAVSQMSNNVYLLTCNATRSQLLIDAADDAPRIV
ncbi:MAG TPA: MBL fold metallo-hydrolase, partial [Intrasporangium sp.]|nr:MBL fold metallo-hydrolase [Intrasporangium sp.]